MKPVLLCLAILLSIFLETTIIQIPFLLITLLLATIFWKGEWIFPVALSSGLILDSLTFRTLGSTSMFLILFLFLVFLYEQKFETDTVWFVVLMGSIGIIAYFITFHNVLEIPSIFIAELICIFLFFTLKLPLSYRADS